MNTAASYVIPSAAQPPSQPLRSMTGFARVRAVTVAGDATFVLKSLNHRALDLHLHVPEALESTVPRLRALLKEGLRRGHVDLRVTWDPVPSPAATRVNRALLEAYVTAFREAAREYGLGGEPDLNSALQLPGMMQSQRRDELPPEVEDQLAAGLAEALTLMNAFREREGEQLRQEMLARQANLIAIARQMESLRAEVVTAIRQRLEHRLDELAAKIDPARLAQEAALLVERSDVAEEISRFIIHVEQLGQLLRAGGEIGKQLEFLLQEIGRETNTVLAKSASAGIAGLPLADQALAAKAEIEKIREQSLNVE